MTDSLIQRVENAVGEARRLNDLSDDKVVVYMNEADARRYYDEMRVKYSSKLLDDITYEYFIERNAVIKADPHVRQGTIEVQFT